jgi:hypothetical protein
MGYGEFDEDEYARFDEMLSFDLTDEVLNGQHDGEMRTEGAEDTAALLDRLESMKNKP